MKENSLCMNSLSVLLYFAYIFTSPFSFNMFDSFYIDSVNICMGNMRCLIIDTFILQKKRIAIYDKRSDRMGIFYLVFREYSEF